MNNSATRGPNEAVVFLTQVMHGCKDVTKLHQRYYNLKQSGHPVCKIQEPTGSEKIRASEGGLNSRAVCLCQL